MILDNFIAFEGIDGSGTSTQIALIKKKAEARNICFSAEPTSSVIGVLLRKILGGEERLSFQAVPYLFAADRAEHLYGKGGILESLQRGKVIITDRYIFSNIAYQGVECGFDIPIKLNSMFPLPHLVFYFSIDPQKSLERIKARGKKEIYEKLDFLRKTKDAYEYALDYYKKQSTDIEIVRLDASLPIEEVTKRIWEHLSKRLCV